jgi:hypothetical protein
MKTSISQLAIIALLCLQAWATQAHGGDRRHGDPAVGESREDLIRLGGRGEASGAGMTFSASTAAAGTAATRSALTAVAGTIAGTDAGMAGRAESRTATGTTTAGPGLTGTVATDTAATVAMTGERTADITGTASGAGRRAGCSTFATTTGTHDATTASGTAGSGTTTGAGTMTTGETAPDRMCATRSGTSCTTSRPGTPSSCTPGTRHHYHGGRYYRPWNAGFILVRPPLGLIVLSLPLGSRTVISAGFTYHVFGDVYYRRVPAGYEVVEPVRSTSRAWPARVSVATDLLNLRYGPDEREEVIAQAGRHTVLNVIGSAPGWLYVEIDGEDMRGWVMERYVTANLGRG